MSDGIRVPSLRQVIIWLVIISCVSFAIGGIITGIDGGKYEGTWSEKITEINVSPGDVKNTEVSLEMETGSIDISANKTDALISGTVSGKNANAGPYQSYNISDRTGYLTIRQEHSIPLDPLSREDTWNFSMGQDLPTSLSVKSGTGSVRIRPGHANLTGLFVEIGTGDLAIDLSEWRGTHLPALIKGGIGSITIILPPDTSLAANVDAGIGSRTITGLEGGDGTYYHSVPDRQAPVISLSVNQGIGDLTMKVAP